MNLIDEQDLQRYNLYDQLRLVFDDNPDFSKEYCQAIAASKSLLVINKGPAMFMADMASPLVNVKDGMRLTVGLPPEYDNTVYLMGDSRLSGYWCEDADTINSHLQALCNRDGRRLRVVNYGCPKGLLEVVYLQLLTLDFKPGDYLAIVQGPVIINPTTDFNHYAVNIKQFCQERQLSCMFFNMLPPPLITPWSKQEQIMIMVDRRNRKLSQELPPPAYIEKTREQYAGALDNLRALDCPVVDLTPVFQRPHDLGEIFVDGSAHFSHRANKQVAAVIHEKFIKPVDDYRKGEKPDVLASAIRNFARIIREQNQDGPEIAKWFEKVPRRELPESAKIGSIVMNCNPFTYGHQFLIETAAAMVDLLYIFVVEEDKSDFPFNDRLRLVRQGVGHLSDKVIVMPSGKFIISSFSFKEYFRKEKITETIDPTNDVAIYGAIIAPELKIKYRFVGEEPHCKVTAQYNQAMLRLLPPMGVEVIVIPRKVEGDAVISASSVRKYLKEGNAEAVQKIVPPTTYEYLAASGRFGNE